MSAFDRDKFRQGTSELRDNLPYVVEHIAINAQLIRAKYNALLKEGFTESQAIELCRTGSALS